MTNSTAGPPPHKDSSNSSSQKPEPQLISEGLTPAPGWTTTRIATDIELWQPPKQPPKQPPSKHPTPEHPSHEQLPFDKQMHSMYQFGKHRPNGPSQFAPVLPQAVKQSFHTFPPTSAPRLFAKHRTQMRPKGTSARSAHGSSIASTLHTSGMASGQLSQPPTQMGYCQDVRMSIESAPQHVEHPHRPQPNFWNNDQTLQIEYASQMRLVLERNLSEDERHPIKIIAAFNRVMKDVQLERYRTKGNHPANTNTKPYYEGRLKIQAVYFASIAYTQLGFTHIAALLLLNPVTLDTWMSEFHCLIQEGDGSRK